MLPSTGSPGAPGFPSFNGTIKRYDFLLPISPHFVSFAWRYLGCTRDYSPRRTSAPSRPGVGNPVSPSGNYRGNWQELPSSWETIVRLHMFQSDAGRTARTRPLRCSSVALGHRKAKAPTKGLSTLNSMAFELVAYASQCGLLQPHARLTSSCWSGSTGRAFHPQGSDERFQSCKLHLVPLSQASLGAMRMTSGSNRSKQNRASCCRSHRPPVVNGTHEVASVCSTDAGYETVDSASDVSLRHSGYSSVVVYLDTEPLIFGTEVYPMEASRPATERWSTNGLTDGAIVFPQEE